MSACRVDGESYGFHDDVRTPGQPEQYLTYHEICSLLRIGKTTWYAGIADGLYPKPVFLGKRSVRWKMSDIVRLQAKLERGAFLSTEVFSEKAHG